jgi:hypothetical protein
MDTNYSPWDELAVNIFDKLAPFIADKDQETRNRIYDEIAKAISAFNDNRVARIYIRLPTPEEIKVIMSKATTRIISMFEKPQDLSRGDSTK